MEESQVPRRFIEALREGERREVAVPREVEERILARGRERCAAVRRGRRMLRLAALASVAAAVILVVISVRFLQPPAPKVSGARVTILDAFALARRIEAGGPFRPEDDVDRDGKVDRGDVDLLAVAAVTLPPREGGVK